MKRVRKQILALLAALTLVLALAAGCGGGQGDDPQQFHAPASGENAGAVEPEDVPEGIQPENAVPAEEQTQDQEPADTRPEDSASAGGQPEEETKAPVDAPSAEPKMEETVKPEPKPEPEPEPVSEPEPEPEEAAPEDGNYTVSVTLEGGTGRATVESPAVLRCENGMFYATIVWSSPNYDYMKVGGEKYLQTNTEGNSTFEIPVAVFDQKLDIIADTVAMSEPHEVEYTLYFDSTTLQKQ